MKKEEIKHFNGMKKDFVRGNAEEKMEEIMTMMERRMEDMKENAKKFKENGSAEEIERFIEELENCSSNMNVRQLAHLAGAIQFNDGVKDAIDKLEEDE